MTDLPALPTEEWIDTASFALSKTSDYNNKFDEERFTLTASEDGYTRSAAVPDTFSGNIYPCFCLSEAGKTAEASIRASYIGIRPENLSANPLRSGAEEQAADKNADARRRWKYGGLPGQRSERKPYAQNEELTLHLEAPANAVRLCISWAAPAHARQRTRPFPEQSICLYL